jgi:uncharacterized damage-inducible protein DinB
MALPELIRTMVEYNDALQRQLWECIFQLNEELFVAPIEYSYGSIRDQMVHLVGMEGRWLRCLQGQRDGCEFRPTPGDYATAKSVYELWDPIAREFRQLACGLDAYALEDTLPRMQGPTWQIILNVVNHGTDHRAQVLRALHDFGIPTFNQDLIYHLWVPKT